MSRTTLTRTTLALIAALGLAACNDAQSDMSERASADPVTPEYAVVEIPNEAVLGALETRDELDDDDLGDVDAAPDAETDVLLDEQDYDVSTEYLPEPK